MQTVTGRLTSDSVVKELKDGRKLIAFSIAENDRYKIKGTEEVKEVTNFYDCSYWISTAIAPHLVKGALIEATGRIGINVWNNLQGEAKASLTLHVNFIKLHGKAKSGNDSAKIISINQEENQPAADDLPF